MPGTGALPVGDEPGDTCGEAGTLGRSCYQRAGQGHQAHEHGSQMMGSHVGWALDWGWGLSPQEHEDEMRVKRYKEKVVLMSWRKEPRGKVTCSRLQGSAGLLETA